jgi:hypothetical protein
LSYKCYFMAKKKDCQLIFTTNNMNGKEELTTELHGGRGGKRFTTKRTLDTDTNKYAVIFI